MENHRACLTIPTLLLGLVGACAGLLFGLAFRPSEGGGLGACLWMDGWTLIGLIQGAAVAPTWHLLRGGELCPSSGLLLGLGGMLTSLVALLMWLAMGHGGRLSLVMGSGLLLLCAAPLCAYVIIRVSPRLPVSL